MVHSTGSWYGASYANPVTNSVWVDTVGTNDGSIVGSPTVVRPHSTPSYTDWFLPSKEELKAMYDNLKQYSVGSFSDEVYISSTETGASTLFSKSFQNGNESTAVSKSGSLNWAVRYARSFIASVGAYSLRDTGPAGGLIFYVDGTTYYEAAPYDTMIGGGYTNDHNYFCNLTSTSAGATGTAVGTGASNTNAFINQSGHLWSIPQASRDFAIL